MALVRGFQARLHQKSLRARTGCSTKEELTRPQLGAFFVLKFVRSRVWGEISSTVSKVLSDCKVLFGNFRPGASFSQNTFSGHATDFFIRRVVLGQESSIL